jgi:hypothetical protein
MGDCRLGFFIGCCGEERNYLFLAIILDKKETLC